MNAKKLLPVELVDLQETVFRYAHLLDALPVAAFLAGDDGTVAHVSGEWRNLLGSDGVEIVGADHLSLVHASQIDRSRELWNAAARNAENYQNEVLFRFGDGSYRWVLIHAKPIRDDAGTRVVGWLGTLTSTDDKKRHEERLRAQVEFNERLIDSTEDCIKVLALDGRLVSMSPNGQKNLRIMNIEAVIGKSWLDFWVGEDRIAAEAALVTAREGGTGRFAGYFPVENKPRWFEVVATPILDESGEPEKLLVVSRDITLERRASQERAFLERVSLALEESLDLQTALQRIVPLIVPQFSDWCQIELRNTDGNLETVAVGNQDAQKVALDSQVLGRTRSHEIARHVTFIEDVSRARDPELDMYRHIGAESVLSIPLIARGAAIGLVRLVYSGSGRRFSKDDIPMFEEMGRRLAIAFHNFRQYEREQRVAAEFQSASLPIALPRSKSFSVDAEYRTAGDEAKVGGDWYDAFLLLDGRLVITIGDVVGHGLHAAIRMSKLRQAMQSAAMVDASPNTMLKIADKTLRLFGADDFATALAAIYDPKLRTLTFASAGHPGPMIRAGDGSVESSTSPGLMLGMRTGEETDVTIVSVSPRSTLVFYTDGLTESTRNILEGEARLRETLQRSDRLRARDIVNDVLGNGAASDDIAVIVIQT